MTMVVKEYENEIKKLLENPESRADLQQLWIGMINSYIDSYAQKTGYSIPENRKKLVSEALLRHSLPLNFENISFLVQQGVSHNPLPFPEPKREIAEKKFGETSEVLVEQLHEKIGFPSFEDLSYAVKYFEETSKLPSNSRNKLNRQFKGTLGKVYEYTKDSKTSVRVIEGLLDVVGRKRKDYERRKDDQDYDPEKEITGIGEFPKILNIIGRVLREKDAFSTPKEWDDISQEEIEEYVKGRPLMASWHLLNQHLIGKEVPETELQGKNVLDVGCGCQSPLIDVLKFKNVKANVVGIDGSKKFLKAMKDSSPQHDYVCAVFPFLPFKEDAFDYAFAINTLDCVNRIQKIPTLVGLDESLKNNGKIITVEPFSESKTEDHFEIKQYLDDMNYKIRSVEGVVDFPVSTSKHLLLIAEKTEDPDRRFEYNRGMAMTYLNRWKSKKDEGMFKKAQETALSIGMNPESWVRELDKEIEKREKINAVEAEKAVASWQPPSLPTGNADSNKIYKKRMEHLVLGIESGLEKCGYTGSFPKFMQEIFTRAIEKNKDRLDWGDVETIAREHGLAWDYGKLVGDLEHMYFPFPLTVKKGITTTLQQAAVLAGKSPWEELKSLSEENEILRDYVRKCENLRNEYKKRVQLTI